MAKTILITGPSSGTGNRAQYKRLNCPAGSPLSAGIEAYLIINSHE